MHSLHISSMISCCRCATDSFSCTWWARAESSFGDQHWRKFEACQKKEYTSIEPQLPWKGMSQIGKNGKDWCQDSHGISLCTQQSNADPPEERLPVCASQEAQRVKFPGFDKWRHHFLVETPFWTDSILLIQVAEEWFDQFLDWLWKGLAAGNGRSHGISWNHMDDLRCESPICPMHDSPWNWPGLLRVLGMNLL